MVVYYPKNNTIYIDLTQTTNYSIENALEHIPICNSDDRFRQRCLLTALHAWTDFAHEHKIQYWIAYGTLIGYVQRDGLLPHDYDIDILMLAQDTQYLVPFADINFSSAYELKVHPQWSTVGYANRSYFPLEGFTFVAPNARFIDRKFRCYVEIWPTYDFHPDQPTNITYLKKTLTDYDRTFNWTSSPIQWTFPLQSCIFSGVKVWCPAMPERLVTMVYGIEAINKTDKKCVNETWISV
ncbi:unnamed protein product [Adineta steineri]|uniref:LicD/FKTN/FKRP nucleotidyltransferase domain-containing protein n=1 Tax=Adineta steineri TaxID=433720 RepID=A0A815EAM3_9BILA|nr:unnamed protein product [Adineta steineri]